MTEQDAFVAAYVDACKNRPADWNEIGLWYARQLWDAALRYEREACAALVASGGNTRMAAAIRARAGLAAPPEE